VRPYDPAPVPGPSDRWPDLGALTGVRSGKRSFYPEYVRSIERLERTVQALDGISRALVRGAEGPRALVEAVVRAAAEHLHARWLLLAVADGALPMVRPRFLLLTDDRLIDDVAHVPAEARAHLAVVRTRPWEVDAPPGGGDCVRAPMILDGEPVGGIAVRPGPGLEVAATDLAILRVLANQAAVALHNAFLFQATARLRGRTEQLSEAAARQARDLAARNAELAEAQRLLMEAMQRQALADERQRIARELHDSVAQHVLSAGMMIEVCRADLAELGPPADQVAARLAPARDLTRVAVERLRAAIYALNNSDEPAGSLPAMLRRLSAARLRTGLTVEVRVVGTEVPLPAAAERSLLRLVGEALFNIAAHADATRARVWLGYRPGCLALTVSDDGVGDPAAMRRLLRLSRTTDLTGRHQGLANMQARAQELGGTMTIRRARTGGVMVRVRIPLAGTEGTEPT
jgi:signal transduction histidine kinase